MPGGRSGMHFCHPDETQGTCYSSIQCETSCTGGVGPAAVAACLAVVEVEHEREGRAAVERRDELSAALGLPRHRRRRADGSGARGRRERERGRVTQLRRAQRGAAQRCHARATEPDRELQHLSCRD